MKYDLLFERFLNPDRVNLPDIDTDFDDDGRGKVLRWVMDKYGHENCAHIITYGTMATKNSIKDVARVEGLPLPGSQCPLQGNSRQTSRRTEDESEKRHTMYARTSASLRLLRTRKKQHHQICQDARGNNSRHRHKHACGFIICRNPISDWVPVCTADDPDFPT